MNILDLDELPRKTHSAYSIYKRIATLIGLIIGVVICINLWLLNQDHAQNWHDKQANQLGRSLIRQAANVLAEPIQVQNYPQIQRVLDITLADTHVIEAVVFDNMGKPLAELAKPAPILAVHTEQSHHQPLVFIQEILHQQQVIGYLRLQLQQGQVMRYHDEYQIQLFEQSQVLMLLSFILGAIVTRAFYKWRIRRYLSKDVKKG